MRGHRKFVFGAIVAVAVLSVAATFGKAPHGALTQDKKCVSETGAEKCKPARGISGADLPVFSPDGKYVYLATTSGLAVFKRSGTTLTQLKGTAGCFGQAAEGCLQLDAATNAYGAAVSSDGRFVYVVGYDHNAVVTLARQTSGALQQVGTCISDSGAAGCTNGYGLAGAIVATLSPDGATLYVGDWDGGIAWFSRNASTGALTEGGCINLTGSDGCASGRGLSNLEGVTVSPDGTTVYTAAYTDNAIAVFSRNTSTGALTQLAGAQGCLNTNGSNSCGTATGLGGAEGVAISPDGKFAYAASYSDNAVTVFSRNAGTGALTQLAGTAGCINADGSGGCADSRGLAGATSVIFSPDASNVYVGSYGLTPAYEGAIAAFARDGVTGQLTQLPGKAACTNDDGSDGCADGHLLAGAGVAAMSPDGKVVAMAGQAGSSVAMFKRGT